MKERISEEAVHLIQQKGFSFTISDLAKNLGTSKRTIYQYFESKDAIIESVIESLIIQIKKSVIDWYFQKERTKKRSRPLIKGLLFISTDKVHYINKMQITILNFLHPYIYLI